MGTGPDTITISNVNVDADFPYLSLITMIAPSPDWVAQVNNLKLTDNSDNWLTSISVDVHATDAGTDSGTTYTSANADTNPAQNISSLENMFPFSSQKIGTFVFTLEQILSVENNTLESNVSIYPNPNNGTFFIKNSGTSIIERMDVYSINGKKLKSFNVFSNQKIVAFNSLKSGLYFLKIYADNSTLIKKLIIE